MTKLSPAQVAILRRMADGECLLQGGPYSLFCWQIQWNTGPRTDSVDKLSAAGFIVAIKHEQWYRAWIITPAGRAYLEGLDCQEHRTPATPLQTL